PFPEFVLHPGKLFQADGTDHFWGWSCGYGHRGITPNIIRAITTTAITTTAMASGTRHDWGGDGVHTVGGWVATGLVGNGPSLRFRSSSKRARPGASAACTSC